MLRIFFMVSTRWMEMERNKSCEAWWSEAISKNGNVLGLSIWNVYKFVSLKNGGCVRNIMKIRKHFLKLVQKI